ncbi:hypothetical protein [Trujillonella humicola]|uniref:hypothetical protein n=1 Tax=Trujillonella humicola TaxID=3383699 RepID=UPI003905F76C
MSATTSPAARFGRALLRSMGRSFGLLYPPFYPWGLRVPYTDGSPAPERTGARSVTGRAPR